MNLVSGTILAVLLLAVCCAARRAAVLALMSGVFLLTQGHAIEVLGLNLYPLRLLEIAAFVRVLTRGELARLAPNRIDVTVLVLYNYSAFVWILRSPTLTAQQFAAGLEPTLCYLALRSLIDTIDDVRWFVNAFVAVLLPYTMLVLVERITGRGAFALVGADPELLFRNDIPRCQGSFRHPIILGSVAASFLSLYLGLFLEGTRRLVAIAGALCCIALVVLANSGGPVMSAAAVMAGWTAWMLRRRMRIIRWASLAMLVFLMLVMKAPIWYLPAKISGIIGGHGYHRSLLMDQAWRDLGRWWLLGIDIRETASWIPYVHDLIGGADVTNQFLTFGIRAGLPALAFSVLVLGFGFAGIGRAMARLRSDPPGRSVEFLHWGLGVTLFVHAVSWWGVAYFDQAFAVWLLHIAAVAVVVRNMGERPAPSVNPAPVIVSHRGRPRRVMPSRPAWRGVASVTAKPVIRRPAFVALRGNHSRDR